MRVRKNTDFLNIRLPSDLREKLELVANQLGYDSVSEYVRHIIDTTVTMELCPERLDELIEKRKELLEEKIHLIKEKILELEREKQLYQQKIRRIDREIMKLYKHIEILEELINREDIMLTESVIESNPSVIQELTERFKDKDSLLERLKRGEITEDNLRNAIKRRLEVCRADTKVPMNKLIQVFKSVHPELANYI